MCYRAVGDRCAVDISSLDLTLSIEQTVERLVMRGFCVLDVDIVSIAKRLVGKAVYNRGARLKDAPRAFDCSSFTKWLYAQRGIWIPRRSPHQFCCGTDVPDEQIAPGDLVFMGGRTSAPLASNLERIGHVGLVCSPQTLVHATPSAPFGVACASLDDWRADPAWRGARRIIPAEHRVLTLQIPSSLEIETSDDALWTILEMLDWEGFSS